MAEKKKIKILRVIMNGTGTNEEFYCLSHDIVSYPASTYHKFVLLNGAECLKNDFGVSSVIKVSVEVSPDELEELARQ